MSIDHLLRALKRRWMFGATIFLLVVLGSSAWTLTRTPLYVASADLFITIAPGTASESLYQDSQFLLGKVASYTELANKPVVLGPVAADIGAKQSLAELSEMVVAREEPGTSIITIEVTSEDPQFATRFANGIAAELGPAIAELEPEGDRATEVDISIVRPAETPLNPVSPRVLLNTLLALIAGLLLGIAAVVARDHFDKTLRSETELSEITGYPTLGSIGTNPGSARRPLVVLDPTSLVTESYRTLRARLRFTEVDSPARSILVTSAVPGEGKTTIAANLALTLTQAQSTVCLVDADLRRPSVATAFGLDGAVGLSDVLAGVYPLEDALLGWGDGYLTVLTAGTNPPDPGKLLGSDQMHAVIEKLSATYDYVIFDTPPLGPVADAAILAQSVDGAIVVSRHGKGNSAKLVEALGALKESNARVLGIVLNAVPKSRSEKRYGRYEAVRS